MHCLCCVLIVPRCVTHTGRLGCVATSWSSVVDQQRVERRPSPKRSVVRVHFHGRTRLSASAWTIRRNVVSRSPSLSAMRMKAGTGGWSGSGMNRKAWSAGVSLSGLSP
jgi:hypothetical protein